MKRSSLLGVILFVVFLSEGICDEDRVERIGNQIVASASTININQTVFLLDDVVLTEGVVFAFSAYFRTKSKVVFQIWRPIDNDPTDSHMLVSYLEAKTSIDKASGREDIYVASRLTEPCTRVQSGDRLGVYFPDSPSGISYVFDPSRANAFGAEVDNVNEMFDVGNTRKFDRLSFPFTFSAAAYVDTNTTLYPNNEDFPECPDLLIPEHLRPELPDLPIAPGVEGSTGSEGPRGEQGRIGVIGFQGTRGMLVGYTGATGPSGHTGPQGNIGEEGIAGTLKGPDGEIGSTGIQGEKGEIGEIGLQGPQGPTGTFMYTTTGYSQLRTLQSSNVHIGLLIWLFVVTAASILLLIIVIVVCMRKRKEFYKEADTESFLDHKTKESVKKFTTLQYAPEDKPSIIYDEIEKPTTLPRARSKENIFSTNTLQSIRSNAGSTISNNSHKSDKNIHSVNSSFQSPLITSSSKNSPHHTPILGSRRQYLDVELEDKNGSWASAINEIYASKLKPDDVISFKEKKQKRDNTKNNSSFDNSIAGDITQSTESLNVSSSFIELPNEDTGEGVHELTLEEIHMY